jgi:hypothetical protein
VLRLSYEDEEPAHMGCDEQHQHRRTPTEGHASHAHCVRDLAQYILYMTTTLSLYNNSPITGLPDQLHDSRARKRT